MRYDDPLYEFFQLRTSGSFASDQELYHQFSNAIWEFYRTQGRTFMWRDHPDPYVILVSEIMLQQTQTQRVSVKLPEFLERFPNFAVLAHTETQPLFQAWVGLGYNRRALALRSTAQVIQEQFQGVLPDDPVVLETFSGIGPATAASIAAFAYNRPTIFIETNIRAVFLHTFFHGQRDVPDAQLLPLVQATLNTDKPRHWYYALMDYGVYIKKTYPNPSRASRHHTKQSKFEGSARQIRGGAVRILSELMPGAVCPDLAEQLKVKFGGSLERIELILDKMCEQKLIIQTERGYSFFRERE